MKKLPFLAAIVAAVLAGATGVLAQTTPPAAAPDTPPAAGDGQPPAGEERAPRHIQIDLNSVLEQARKAAREGRLEEAARLYQLVLRFVPEARAVRIELSFVLAAMGQRNAASRLLRDVNREGLDPEVIATIDRIVGPGALTFFVIPEVILDSNINGQTKKDFIVIGNTVLALSEDAQGREAYGLGLTAGTAWRFHDEAPRSTLTLGARVRDLQGSQDDESTVFSSLSFGFDTGQRSTLIPSLSGVYRWKAHDAYEMEGSFGLSEAFDLGPVRTTVAGRYRRVYGVGDQKDRLDRKRYEASTSFGYGVPALGVRFDGRVFREDWRVTETEDNEGFRTGLDLIFAKVPVILPTLGGAFTLTDYENPANFFNVRRLDREYEGRLDLTLRDFDPFGTGPLTLRYTYTHSTSNIPLFDYDKHQFTIVVRPFTF